MPYLKLLQFPCQLIYRNKDLAGFKTNSLNNLNHPKLWQELGLIDAINRFFETLL